MARPAFNSPSSASARRRSGQEFRSVTMDEALQSVRVALDCGLNFIDTSPFYGRGMSEVLLGIALQRRAARQLHALLEARPLRPRSTSTSRAKRVAESVDVTLHRLGTDHLDIMLCHDIEFVPMQQIVDETMPGAAQGPAGRARSASSASAVTR
ncbi:MAG: aldo/keto reductase [Burkholderiaceae bacterium]